MTISRRRFNAALSASLALPTLMGRASAQGATMKIGMCAPVTGPAAESGRYAQIGAKLAVDAVNKAGGVLGKQVELIVEDDQTTNPGVVLASPNWRRNRHRGVPRLDPFDAGPCDVARRVEGRQAGHDRRHRSGADAHGQPVVVSLPPERFVLRQRDRRLRRARRWARRSGRSCTRPTPSAPRAARR